MPTCRGQAFLILSPTHLFDRVPDADKGQDEGGEFVVADVDVAHVEPEGLQHALQVDGVVAELVLL